MKKQQYFNLESKIKIMSIAELKENICSIVEQMENPQQLEMVLEELNIINSADFKKIEEIENSEEFKRDIEESLAQIERGEVIPNEVIMKKLDEWASK